MMRKIGLIIFLAGLLLIGSSVGLLLFNQHEEEQAAEFVEAAAPQVVRVIEQRQSQPPEQPKKDVPLFIQNLGPDPNRDMPVVEIDGHSYIGYLAIPSLELELPIMADWSYPKLKIAPCHYAGSLYLDNLVLMAHNYERHFGKISELRTGDTVMFTDMDGLTVEYEVVALDILVPTAIEEMVAGEYDLTLFTCTYGGKSRVTLRCMKAE